MMKNWKLICTTICLAGLMMIVSCGPDFVPAFDSEEQFAIDIELIEAYLADHGYTDYDTLDSGVRVLILEEGDGAPIEYGDIISYHYIGTQTTDLIFDTSISKLAFDQDTLHTIGDITFKKDDDDEIKYDVNNLPLIDVIEYEEGYYPAYFYNRTYSSLKTTHTPGGWYLQLEGSIQGFRDGTHYVLDHTNLGGRGLMLLPSRLAYGNNAQSGQLRNVPLIFEIRPFFKR